MARLVAVANQKGGVAKTTTVHSLGYALTELGRRVLLVDLDPQACLTYSTGIDPERLDSSLHDVIIRRLSTAEVRRPVQGAVGLDILPANLDLGASEMHLLTRPGRDHVLARALATVRDEYDIVLIDCPPSWPADHQRLDGGGGSPDPVPMRDPEQSGRSSAPRDDRGHQGLHECEPRGAGLDRDDVRSSHAAPTGDPRLRPRPLRVACARPAGAKVDPICRGARASPVHLGGSPLVARGPGIPGTRPAARFSAPSRRKSLCRRGVDTTASRQPAHPGGLSRPHGVPTLASTTHGGARATS